MKSLLFVLMVIAFNVHAQEKKGAPKFLLCMEASYVAGEAFDRKQQGRKLEYPPATGDIIYDAFLKEATLIGRKAKSFSEAVDTANKACVNSKFWQELNLR